MTCPSLHFSPDMYPIENVWALLKLRAIACGAQYIHYLGAAIEGDWASLTPPWSRGWTFLLFSNWQIFDPLTAQDSHAKDWLVHEIYSKLRITLNSSLSLMNERRWKWSCLETQSPLKHTTNSWSIHFQYEGSSIRSACTAFQTHMARALRKPTFGASQNFSRKSFLSWRTRNRAEESTWHLTLVGTVDKKQWRTK